MPEIEAARNSATGPFAADTPGLAAAPAPSVIPDRGHDALDVLAEERATFQSRLPDLLRAHAGRFVLIKGQDVVACFDDRDAALREGYRRFGVVSFLVRKVAEEDAVVYLPNVVP